MGSVLEMMPNQPDATKLQLQAAENIRTMNPVAYWIDRLGAGVLVGIGVLLAGVVLVVVLARSRKPAVRVNPHTVQLKPSVALAPVAVPAAAPVAAPAKPALAQPESFGSLYINNGPLSGNQFAIPKKGLLVGRDPSLCSVVLQDDTVSKEHAWIVPLDNGVAVIDRSSANGTYVNSTDSPRISKMLLKSGDHIFIGRKDATEITYFGS
jgi:hypothetical protein